MIRFVLTTTAFCFALAVTARSVGAPENSAVPIPTPAKANPVYVKIIWPVDPANLPVVRKDRPVVESWIVKNVHDRPQVSLTAMTAWVPLVEDRFEATAVWNGKLDEKEYACHVSADIIERKDGRIKILLQGWGPGPCEVIVALDDEPGSREVAPVTHAKTERGTPHVAILIAPQVQ